MDSVLRWVRALSEKGVLDAVAGALVARPPVSGLNSSECLSGTPDRSGSFRMALRSGSMAVPARSAPTTAEASAEGRTARLSLAYIAMYR